MNYSEMLTPELLELVLPTLGFSILLNFLLMAALLFRTIRGWLTGQLYTFWVGLRMTARSNQ